MTTSTVSFAMVESKVGTHLKTMETNLNKFITDLGATPTTADLIALQRNTTEWSLIVDLNATLNKTLSDTMKGVVQKSG